MSPCLVRAEPGTSRLQPPLIGVKTADGAPEAAVACAPGDAPAPSSEGSSAARHALSVAVVAPPPVAAAAVAAAGAGSGGSKLLASQSLTVLPLTAG